MSAEGNFAADDARQTAKRLAKPMVWLQKQG
jgi:hypothetical protein